VPLSGEIGQIRQIMPIESPALHVRQPHPCCMMKTKRREGNKKYGKKPKMT
jgi:hypothetical protein